MKVVLRLSPEIAEGDPIRGHDGVGLDVQPGTVRLDIPYDWSAYPTNRTEDDAQVWEIRYRPEETK